MQLHRKQVCTAKKIVDFTLFNNNHRETKSHGDSKAKLPPMQQNGAKTLIRIACVPLDSGSLCCRFSIAFPSLLLMWSENGSEYFNKCEHRENRIITASFSRMVEAPHEAHKQFKKDSISTEGKFGEMTVLLSNSATPLTRRRGPERRR